MTAWEELLIGAALLAVLATLVLAAWGRWRTRRVMLRLERMLEEAIRGTFTETSFDESLFSAVRPSWPTTLLPPRSPPGTCRRKRTRSRV